MRRDVDRAVPVRPSGEDRMTERQITIFLFVPGREWLMTTANVVSDSELKDVVTDFAKKHGDGKWTKVRVYTQPPEWEGRPGTIEWNTPLTPSRESEPD